MELSIVIVNYNVKYFLEQCLHSVEKACEGIQSEVFVVDNNSVDGSIGMVIHKFPWVKLIANKKNLGFSKANNQAIRQCKGKYILLLNPDTVVEEKTFEAVLRFMNEHDDAGGLGVKMIDGKGQFLPESKRGLPTPMVAFYRIFGLASLFPKSKRFGKYHLSYLSADETHEVEVLAGAFMLLRKSLIDEIGALDETFFMYGEDIDLSYRITQAGFKNYYFPETTIIHYKGESTKKGSLNYVKVFYNAMIIFAKKHFSKGYAKWFSLLIHIAIYFRAILAGIWRVSKKMLLPVSDFIVLYASLFGIIQFWESFQYNEGYYPPRFLYGILPLYILIWQLLVFFSGGYDKPVKILKIFRGVIWGLILILAIYAMLPETLRFSRIIILFGFGVSLLGYLTSRILISLSGKTEFRLGTELPKRIAIIGFKEESIRVQKLLEEIGFKYELIGFITPKRKYRSERYLGSIYQMSEILKIHTIDELIFCAADVSAQKMIKTMLSITEKKVHYKVASPESVSIIGSNSIDTAGNLYSVNVNAISKESNKRNKRLVDIVISTLFILGLPITFWLFRNKNTFLRNTFHVLFGKYSWVGYYPTNDENHLQLPVIKPGIIKITDAYDHLPYKIERINQINTTYARDYKTTTDLEIIYKCFLKIGQ